MMTPVLAAFLAQHASTVRSGSTELGWLARPCAWR